MRKRLNLLGSIVAATVLLAASPASAQYDGSKIWEIYCYSDATYQTWVGTLVFDGCVGGQAYYRVFGTYTTYQIVEGPVGSCEDQ